MNFTILTDNDPKISQPEIIKIELMNHQKTDVNITPAPLIATQLEDNNNNINELEEEQKQEKDNGVISSYLHKHLNLIVSRSNLSSDDQKEQQQQQSTDHVVIQKSSYKRLPPKFGVLYANKSTTTSDETQQKQNETELGSNEETNYSVIQSKPKTHINLSLQETGPKNPPSLHHPMYQYPSNSSNQTTTHLINPLLFGRNPTTTTTTNSTNQITTTSTNTANRFEILMKSNNSFLNNIRLLIFFLNKIKKQQMIEF